MAVSILMAGTTALADQAWWTGAAGNKWNSGLTNWNTSETSGTPVSALPGVNTDVYFSATSPKPINLTNSLGTSFTVNSLTFTSRSGRVTIDPDLGVVALTIAASGGNGITVEGGTSRRFVYTTVRLGGPQTWTNNAPLGVHALDFNSSIDSVAPGGQLTIAGSGNTSISGNIGSNITGGLIKTGTGTLGISNPGNTFTGGLTINGGVLSGSDNALGAASNWIILNAGGTFAGGSGFTLGASRVITVNGSAANPSGLRIGSGVSFVSGAGQWVGSGTLRVTTSSNSSVGTLAVDGANSGFTGQMVVGGQGLLVGDTYNKRNFEPGSTATGLALRSAGSLANATGFTFKHSSQLSITQSAAAVTGRLGAAPLTFHSAEFQYNSSANGGAAINDTFGAVTVTGNATILGSGAAGPAAGTTLNFGNLTRTDRATVLFRAPAAGTQGAIGGAPASTAVRIFFANLTPDTVTAGTTRSVVPWASNLTTLSGFNRLDNLMTYDANGFRPLNVATETTSSLGAGANFRPTGGSTSIPGGGISINSLSVPALSSNGISGNATATVQGNVLTIASGAIANGGSFIFNDATVNFSNGGYLHLSDYLQVAGNSRFVGSGGITVAGPYTSGGDLRFTNTPNGGNTFTGGLYVNGNASVLFTRNNQLGNNNLGQASGDIVLAGGGLFYELGTAVTASLSDGASTRAIRVNESGGTIGSGASGAILQIPGTISGAGQVMFGGALESDSSGIVELTNTSANTYTGGTVVGWGILRISNPNQLGTGTVFLNQGTLQAATNLNFASAPIFVQSSAIDTQANSVTFDAGINGSAGAEGSGPSKVLSKRGAGTLTIAGAGDFAGELSVRGGLVRVSGTMSGLSAVAVDSTATVELGASHRISDDATLTLGGGTFATAGFSEDLNTLSLSGNVASVIDFGNGSSRLTLADSSFLNSSWNGTLSIRNWSGSPTGGGLDQLFFGSSSSGLTASQISKISFVDPTGYLSGVYAAELLPTGELTAVVPEPGSASLLLGGGLALLSLRRKRGKTIGSKA